MTRQESKIMKGVAILLMLFLHLFNQQWNVALCDTYLYIDDTPLLTYLVRAANPVSFFLILGGYGMYCVWKKGDKHRWTRIWKLMLHYWIVLLVFVTIGHFMLPDRYPGGWLNVLGNVTAFDTSYNAEMWFLFPYICLSLLSPWLFKFCARFRVCYVLSVSFVISLGTSFVISRYGAQYLYHKMWVYNPFLIVHLSFAFLLGAMAAREGLWCRGYGTSTPLSINLWKPFGNYKITIGGGNYEELRNLGNEKIWNHETLKLWNHRVWIWGALIALVAFRCCFDTSAFHTLYAFAFIWLFIRAPRWGWVVKVLAELGNKSMGMWMIHSWFCYYLFHDWIYGFRYPLVIMVVLVVVSYLTAVVVGKIANIIQRI